MNPAQARLKGKVRLGIELCGGIDGASATAERSRSQAGNWHNRDKPSFPPVDCALALDGVAVARGELPPIAAALARELGGVFVFLPRGAPGPDDLHAMLADHCRRAGELQASLAEILQDGRIGRDEAQQAQATAEAQLTVLVEMIDGLKSIADGA